MKIRFEDANQRQAGQDQGLKVNYGPAKRTAFRLRWYLILLLVASPVLYFLYTLARDTFSSEVAAMVWLPQHELLAQAPGFVTEIEIEPWARAQEGQRVVRKNNPTLAEQSRRIVDELAELETRVGRVGAERAASLDSRIGLLQNSMRVYREQEARLEGLVEANAANASELLPVRAERARVEERIAELRGERDRLPRSDDVATWPEAMQLRHDQLKAERARIELDQALLDKRFELDGMVTEILVREGQFVDTGTALLRYSGADLRVIAYVEPRHLQRRIETGAEVKLILPDRTRHAAIVRDTTGVAAQLPPGLRTGFGADASMVPIIVEPSEPLPPVWRIDRLPLRVAF